MAEKIYNRNPAPMPEKTVVKTKFATLATLAKIAGSVADTVAQQNYAVGIKLESQRLISEAYKNNPTSIEGFNRDVEKGLEKMAQNQGLLPGVVNKVRENIALNSNNTILTIEKNIKAKQNETAKLLAQNNLDAWNAQMQQAYTNMYAAQANNDEDGIKRSAEVITQLKRQAAGASQMITNNGYVYSASDRKKLASGEYDSMTIFKETINGMSPEYLKNFYANTFANEKKWREETGITLKDYEDQRKYIESRQKLLKEMADNDIKNNVEFAQATAIANGDLESVDALRDTGYVNDDLYDAMKKAFKTKNTTVSKVESATKLSHMLTALEPLISNTDDSEQGKAARFTAATEILKGYSTFARENELTDEDQQDFMTMLSKTLVDKNFSDALQPAFAGTAINEALNVMTAVSDRTSPFNNPAFQKIAGQNRFGRAMIDPETRRMMAFGMSDLPLAVSRANENARSYAVDVMRTAITAAAVGDYDQAQSVLEAGNKQIIKIQASPYGLTEYDWNRLERLYNEGKPAPYEYMGKVYYFKGFTNKNAIFTTKVN